MPKLNQIIAVETGIKSRTDRELTNIHKQNQKPALFTGIYRTYEPLAEDGDKFPSETTQVQVNVEDQLKDAASVLTDLFDVTFTKDKANAVAQADVVVDKVKILEAVPVTYLLFLEKKLVDLHKFVDTLPTLDPAQRWTKNQNTGVFETDEVKTVKTKKIPRNHVLAAATDKHPAQVELFHEDVVVGEWTKVDTSGAISIARKRELLGRVESLQNAVKFAREEANNSEVTDAKIASKVFGYLFA